MKIRKRFSLAVTLGWGLPTLLGSLAGTLSRAHAESLVVFPVSQGQGVEIPLGARTRPVFSVAERQALHDLARGSRTFDRTILDAKVVEISDPTQTLRYRRALRSARQRFEDNAVVTLQGVAQRDLRELQWGIQNTGRPVDYTVSGFQRLEIPGSGGDSGAVRVPEPPQSRPVRVAVLDTGVDATHPRLQARVFRNEAECEALKAYRACLASGSQCGDLARVDADGNGYPLDCMGWNPADSRVDPVTGVRGSGETTDTLGHGTHVAGVIAAEGSDGGPTGVSQSARVIPVKVITEDPNAPPRPQSLSLPDPKEAGLGSAQVLSDVVARGLLYALRSGAEVVNLSLAWPAQAQTPLMREMLDLALERGVVVVAAAANDGTEARVFPCASEGVLCVGAHGPDDGLSHFSNYGPAVDVAAPGFGIVSTYPLAVASRQLLRSGYEVKFGTSMASPFVAGAAARLLALGCSPSEVRARILLGTRAERRSTIENPRAESKFTQFGLLDLERALGVVPQPLIRPLTKSLPRLRWNGVSRTVPFEVRLQNSWSPAGDVEISIAPVTSGIQMSGGPVIVKRETGWASQEIRGIPLTIEILDSNLDDILGFEVLVRADGFPSRRYRVWAELGVTVAPETPGVRSIPMAPGAVPKGARLWSVTSAQTPERQDYLAISVAKSQTSPNTGTPELSLRLLREEAGVYQAQGDARLSVTGVPQVFSLRRLDLNLDGTPDVLVVLRVTVPPESAGGKPQVVYEFHAFTDEMKPLRWTFSGESVLVHRTDVVDLSDGFQMAAVEGRLFPVWVGVGFVPKASQKPPSHWSRPEGKGIRLYAYTARGLEEVRAPDGDVLSNAEASSLLPPSVEQRNRNGVPVLLREEPSKMERLLGIPERYRIAEWSDGKLKWSHDLDRGPYRFALSPDVRSILVGEGRGDAGAAFVAPGAGYGLEVIGLWNQREVQEIHVQPGAPVDSIMNLVGTAVTRRQGRWAFDAFVQSLYGLEFRDGLTGDVVQVSSRRDSFLPTAASSKKFFPAIVRRQGAAVPAAFVPNRVAEDFGMEVFVPEWNSEGRLVRLLRPASLRLAPRAGCEDLANLVESSDPNQAPELALFCGDHFLRVKLEL